MDELAELDQDTRTAEPVTYAKLLEDGSDLHPVLREHVLRLADEALEGSTLVDDRPSGPVQETTDQSTQNEDEKEHSPADQDSVSAEHDLDHTILDIGEAAVETIPQTPEQTTAQKLPDSKKEYRDGLSKEDYDKLSQTSTYYRSNSPYLLMYIAKYRKLKQPPDSSEVEELQKWALHIAEIHTSTRAVMVDLIDRGEQKAELGQFPSVVELFNELGIDSELQEKMFNSWLTYKPVTGLDFKKPEDIKKYSDMKAHKIASELARLSEYEQVYGQEELVEVARTFGIRHFSRYKVEILHNQLLKWKSGKLPVGNVVATAVTDWNNAFNSAGTDLFEELKDDSTVFFEVGEPSDIGRVAVKVGNRERDNGRLPEAGNYVKNFIIAGHGNPDRIAIGTDASERLTVGDYSRADNGRKRLSASINNYRRHLGNNFQVILDSCSTAGANGNRADIAEKISDSHDVLVKANTVPGTMKINEDGEVVFKISKRGKVSVAATLDGRDGDGIQESYPFKLRMRKWRDQIKQKLDK